MSVARTLEKLGITEAEFRELVRELDRKPYSWIGDDVRFPGKVSFDRDVKWEAWTPTWTATTTDPTLGNGVLSGRYFRNGKFVHCNLFLEFGSTTTEGVGTWEFSAPVTAANLLGCGAAKLLNHLVKYYVAVATFPVTTTKIRVFSEANTGAPIGSGIPFAWGVNDKMQFSLSYEAA